MVGYSLVLIPSMAFAGGLPAGAGAAAESVELEARRLEHGEGVARDEARAALLYCEAARLGDASSQYRLGWMYAWGRGVPRHDAWAAYLFKAAAHQGIEQAGNMLRLVGGESEMPDCIREPLDERPSETAQTSVVTADSGSAPMVSHPKIEAPKAIAAMVQTLAPAYGVEPQLVLAIMKAESNFNAQALSPKNAMGLMQLIPTTAERFQVRNPFDSGQKLRGGLAYLRWLLAYFQGDLPLVVAAYNAGEGAVDRHGGVPPYSETRSYVRRVLAAVGKLVHPFDTAVTPPSPRLRLMQKPLVSSEAALSPTSGSGAQGATAVDFATVLSRRVPLR